MRAVLHFLVVAATFLVLSRVLPGLHVTGWVPALLAALILAVVNAVIRPILFVLTLPLTILTLGLFLFVLNAAMLLFTAWIVPGLSVHGWGTAILAALVLSIVGMLWKSLTRDDRLRLA
jgi:putative membrane protein